MKPIHEGGYIIAVDLDGTILENEYPKLGEPIEGAKESLIELKRQGHRIVIWTCRVNVNLVARHLRKHGIPFDAINSNDALTKEERAKFGNNESRKIGADIYIDDRGLRFCDWEETMLMLDELFERE